MICMKAPLCSCWWDFWMSYIGLKNCSLKNVLTLKKDKIYSALGYCFKRRKNIFFKMNLNIFLKHQYFIVSIII